MVNILISIIHMHPCSVDELEIIRYRMAITIALYIHIDRVRAGHCKVITVEPP